MNRTHNKIIAQADLNKVIDRWKEEGQRIVFTNGCFDLLHPGHIDYLEQAKGKGDKLVIGLNTDRSVSEIKGPERPINNEKFRSILLAALDCVDAVILFDESTPLQLIKQVKPHILVKGSDYEISNIVGANDVIKSGGKVETIPFLEGYSSTQIIEKIKSKT